VITLARADDLPAVRELILEYASALGVDLSFQDFDHEMATLEKYYEVILIARKGGAAPHGCVALRRMDEETCEMKRLYVQPAFRRHEVGRQLAETIIEIARQRGYARMRLDTLPMMTGAMRLYESLGFTDIAPYRFNPIEGSRFLELDLTAT
jgi:ribosomal protein S18 acetylase RimI-like enzyme